MFAAKTSRLLGMPAPALAQLRRTALGHEVYGYVLERMWLHLFGMEFLLPALLPETAAPVPVVPPGPIFVPLDRTSPGRRKLNKAVRKIGRLVRGG